MGRIIIHARELADELFGPAPEELPAVLALTAEQSSRLLKSRIASLRARASAFGLAFAGSTPDVIRAKVLDVAGELVDAKGLAAAGCLLEIVNAIDAGMEPILETYLREIMIASGRDGAWEQACRQCGCTNDRACDASPSQPFGCDWIESDLCSACFDKMFPRIVLPLTMEEAKAAYEAAEPVTLAPGRVEEIVRYATAPRPKEH